MPHPYDGNPYYCAQCGALPEEQASCPDAPCCLETKEVALARRLRQRKVEPTISEPSS